MHSLGPGGKRRAFKAAGVGDKCAAQVRTGTNVCTRRCIHTWVHARQHLPTCVCGRARSHLNEQLLC